MRLGVLIVTCNSARHIAACLEACRAQAPPASEILVVDNASRDDTLRAVSQFSGVYCIPNRDNRGFAGAVNQGIAALDCDLVLLLNPDVRLQSPLAPMLEAFGDPALGACGGRLTGTAGEPQRGFVLRRFPTPVALCFECLGLNRLWPSNPVNRSYRCLDVDLDQPSEAEQPAGALLMLRREAWSALGGFDEGYWPLWFEDVDFLLRLRRAGYRTLYVPQVEGVHQGGHSLDALEWTSRQLYWYGSLLRYAELNFAAGGRWGVAAAVCCGAGLRAVIQSVRRISPRPLAVCGRLVPLVVRSLMRGRMRRTTTRPEAGVTGPV
jgi:GT2 family glycosyltransferase